jgi:hypothetical protein
MVNGFHDGFLGCLKLIFDVAKVFENFGNQAGLFCDLAHGGLFGGFISLWMTLRHTPVDAIAAVQPAD